MKLKVKVYSDYVCPFCFLGKDQFEKAMEGKEVDVEWMPYELRPRPSEQLDPANDPVKSELWKNAISPRAKAWNIDMKLPDVSPHPYTDLAHQGFLYARDMGKGADYNKRVFKAFYQEDKNIGEIDVLAKLAAEVGLDEAEFQKALVSGKYQEAHQQALAHAYEEAQITSVPTFLIGEERIEGAASKEVFEQVIDSELKKIKNLRR
ncbi:DsbA family oxidoreductase [Lacrimispora sp.]|uniref:DsbA family oxidoreductase n=1 Tax=Lacrimispora sp. TaxID=2719234 RepID=UPI002898D69F|nr:DsbA family oxidoreductase [Lacrimispora sp.]